MPKLQLNDYVNLLKLSEGRAPLWDTQALQRCVTAGYVCGSGNFLTPYGIEQARILKVYVDELKAGVPLSRRHVDRSKEMTQDTWFRTDFREIPCFLTASACFWGRTPEYISAQATRIELPSALNYELIGYQNSKTFGKMVPYAVQIDELGKNELICLKPVVVKSKNRPCRIHSRYFDYLMHQYEGRLSWWQRYSKDLIPVLVVKYENGQPNYSHFGEKIVAFMRGFRLKRKFPDLSMPGLEMAPRKSMQADIDTDNESKFHSESHEMSA